jgi:hypothetical protein
METIGKQTQPGHEQKEIEVLADCGLRTIPGSDRLVKSAQQEAACPGRAVTLATTTVAQAALFSMCSLTLVAVYTTGGIVDA